MESMERAIARAIVEMIQSQLGTSDTIPVLRSDENVETDDFTRIWVEVKRDSTPLLIGGDSYHGDLYQYSASVELCSMALDEDGDLMSARDRAIEESIQGENGIDVDLSSFVVFTVLRGGTVETETDPDGHRYRKRNYTLHVQESLG
jgi:hypothetical protein